MRVLVTGGAGYIGSCATSILLDEGFEVTVLDDCSTGHAQSVDSRAKFIKASILDITAVRQALAGCDAVLHLAAKALVGESVAKPELYHQVNVGGSKNLLTEMAAAGVGKLVFSSTAATYGQPKTSPISEDAQTLPTNPYGQSKLEVDQMIAEAAKNGLAAISLRYFNVSGAHKTKSGWLAECHDPETHLIPIALKATPYAPLNIFGTDWPTPDGTCVRDYIHVFDLINAKVAALRNLRPGRHSVINLGSGVGYSVTEVISTAASVVGRDIPHVNSARRPGDPAILLADIKKAKTELDWSPTRSLRQMINDTWESQNDHG